MSEPILSGTVLISMHLESFCEHEPPENFDLL